MTSPSTRVESSILFPFASLKILTEPDFTRKMVLASSPCRKRYSPSLKFRITSFWALLIVLLASYLKRGRYENLLLRKLLVF